CQAVAVLAVGSAVAPSLLPLAVGERYGAAVLPLCLLLGANVATAAASMLGTLAMAIKRTRLIVGQIAACLVLNLALTTALAGPLGANGAALGMLATELLACVLLAAGLAGTREQRANRAVEQLSF